MVLTGTIQVILCVKQLLGIIEKKTQKHGKKLYSIILFVRMQCGALAELHGMYIASTAFT